MSSVLPFEIIDQVIDIVGDNNDTNLLKDLALVSHSFHQICSKHLFATIDLHHANCKSSKKGFIKLLQSRPDVANYIRKLTYNTDGLGYGDDFRLSPKLSKLLRTISRLNCLAINASCFNWNTLDPSLTSALLYLMHLPTANHIDLSFIQNFPLSSLTKSVNLLRLDIFYLCRLNPLDEDPSEIVSLLEMMPKICEFHTSRSALLTTKLLHAKRQDGLPAFNFMDLRKVSMSFTQVKDERNIRYLLQNAKLLENFRLSVGSNQSLLWLRDILTRSARTLKVLDFEISLYDEIYVMPLAGLCEELEVMEGNNMLEVLSFQINVRGDESKDLIGSIIRNVENVLVKPGWPALKQVSLKISIASSLVSGAESAALSEALQSIPNEYLSRLSQLESIVFNFSASVVECKA